MTKITKITIDIPSELKNRVKASAALEGKKMKDYVITALQEKMQNDKDREEMSGEGSIKEKGYISF